MPLFITHVHSLVNCFWVQCCSEKESWLVLWLLRNNSPLCRQLPVLPWVKSPGLSSPSSGMGSSDKFGAVIGITPCCVSHEFPNIPPALCGVSLGLGMPSKNCFSPSPCFSSRHPLVTLTAWKSLLQEISEAFF